MKFIGLDICGFLFLAGVIACGGGDTAGTNRGRGSSAASSAGTGGPGSAASGGAFGLDTGPSNGGLLPGAGAPGRPPEKLPEGVCASAKVSATRITPTVILVIDGSSSMNMPLGGGGGGGTRWQVLREALVGQSGVVTKLDSVVNFGMAIYSNSDPMACPTMVEVKPAAKNLMTMSAQYPAMETGGGTPTGEALQKVVDGLPDFNNLLDSDTKPPIIILATDGEPNGCANAATCNWVDWANCLGQLLGTLAAAPATYDTTLTAVRAAKTKGIPLWVISLANGLNAIPDLQRTANIGAGLAETANPGATIYSPTNPDELTSTLTKLIGDVVECDVSLNGTLNVARACEGTVNMNSVKLECNSADGWKPLDEKHISLQGSACQKFKSDPSVLLDAQFPCGVIVPD
jgi:Mg-chelatase subunit ChlD